MWFFIFVFLSRNYIFFAFKLTLESQRFPVLGEVFFCIGTVFSVDLLYKEELNLMLEILDF